LIPEFEEVRQLSREHQAYATVISGAGPTILTLCPRERSGELVRALRDRITHCTSELATINEKGVIEEVVYLKS
ncbi:homoserine kinase, partial [Staphylococcus aureus]|nr:homoserine kinase [Staphylococcus aureus]